MDYPVVIKKFHLSAAVDALLTEANGKKIVILTQKEVKWETVKLVQKEELELRLYCFARESCCTEPGPVTQILILEPSRADPSPGLMPALLQSDPVLSSVGSPVAPVCVGITNILSLQLPGTISAQIYNDRDVAGAP